MGKIAAINRGGCAPFRSLGFNTKTALRKLALCELLNHLEKSLFFPFLINTSSIWINSTVKATGDTFSLDKQHCCRRISRPRSTFSLEVGQISKEEKLRATLAELFPLSSYVNLQHLNPLYVTAHIEGYPISKVFVYCGATVNIMPMSIMRALRRSNDELISSGITTSSFVGEKSQTKGVLSLEVSVAGRNHMTAFFIVDSNTEYNALLSRDWIHQTGCIPSSLYQVLIFWDGKSVVVHPAHNQSFKANMIQARYYDDHVATLPCRVLTRNDD